MRSYFDTEFLLAVLAAFLVTIFLSLVARPLAVKIKLVDSPGGRKVHKGDIPLIGGITMFIGMLVSVLVLQAPFLIYKSLLGGMILLLLVGVLDDMQELKPKTKFFFQIIASFIMISWGGMAIDSFGSIFTSNPLILNNWAVPFTVFFTVGAINAMNMMDGIDGLAGGLSMITHFCFLLVCLYHGRVMEAQILVLFLVAMMSFLIFNLRLPGNKKVKIFMGDGGSMFLGFSVAWFSILLSQGPDPIMKPVSSLWFFGLPLLDTVCIIFRRMMKRKSPFSPDRTHFHHILQRAGYSVNRTNTVMFLTAVSFGIIGLVWEYFHWRDNLSFLFFIILFIFYNFWNSLSWKFIKISRKRKRRQGNF